MDPKILTEEWHLGPDVMEIIKIFGFPTFCVIVLGYAFWSILRWIGTKMVEPGMKNLNEVTETMKSVEKSITEQTLINKGVYECVKGIESKINQQWEATGALVKRVDRIETIIETKKN